MEISFRQHWIQIVCILIQIQSHFASQNCPIYILHRFYSFNLAHIYTVMQARKRCKAEEEQSFHLTHSFFQNLYQNILQTSHQSEENPYVSLIHKIKCSKHPILQTLQPQNDIYKPSSQKKKKPMENYLEVVNQLYKKYDLQILINPVTPISAFEKWAPREVAIFEQAILRFGKQFEFISQMIETKNAREVYQFYLEWKNTYHYRSYRGHVTFGNRNNIQDYI